MRSWVQKLAALTVLWGAACATTSMLPPIEPPSRLSFDQSLIEQGAKLATIGNCAQCHTAPQGRTYAGGHSIKTPFGTIYGSNITPDPDTGIGRWSEDAFIRAMREGVDREGRHLYPAFPYDHYTLLTDADLHALYAFMMTRDPVRAVSPPNTLRFPYNNRSLIAMWKALFFERAVFRNDPTHSAEWNRGAYLVQGLAHCGACHTPRNALGAEDKRHDLAGGDVEGWHAPALNSDSPAPIAWTAEHLYKYLRTGLDDQHEIAAGPMGPVVRDLANVSPDDVRAIAEYIAKNISASKVDERIQGGDVLRTKRLRPTHYPEVRGEDKTADPAWRNGAAIYRHACGTCHDQGRGESSSAALELSLASAVTLPTSANLMRITLEGITPPDGERGRWMPGFAGALTDDQVNDLSSYVRFYFGRQPPWFDIKDQNKKVDDDERQ